jgi:RNA polymerase sigma factor (sigma-70 family)
VPSPIPTRAEARPVRAEDLAGRLYSEHRLHLLSIARRNCGGSQEAEGTLQDALVLFIEHFDPGGGSPPLPWLILTLKRRCWAIYAQRRKAPRPTRPLRLERLTRDRGLVPQDLFEVAEESELLRRGLAALKPDQRRALALLALGYSYHEIAAICGCSWSKVNRRLTEGRARLRELGAAGDPGVR